ncbi:MAG TPA: ATP-binding protein [Myxococcales bacterium]|nr:ATP-binding protein [Myxococcales bacterium]
MEQDDLRPSGQRLEEAERRQRLLSEISRVLLDYVGPDEIEPLRRIVAKVTAAMGNDWCAFSLVQADGTLKNVATYHPDPRQRALEQKLNALVPPSPWDKDPAERNALIQRRTIVTENITDEMLRAAMPSEEAFLAVKEVGLTSAVVAPMFDGPDPMGTLLLATTNAQGRRYSQDDADFAFSLAGRAALAVRNARLVRELARERDRSELERAEADRRLAEMRAVFDADPNGIALFDAEGVLRMASRKIEEIFGIPLRSMYGTSYQEIYSQKLQAAVTRDREAMMERVRAIFADRESPSVDEIELEQPRHRWLTRTSVPVQGPRGDYLGRLVVYIDVTEHRELDQQRSDFLTMAAHELRTPLTPLSMYLQNIQRRVSRGDPIEPDHLSKARRQVERLSRLVEDLLDISRLESRRLQLASEEVDLCDLAQQVAADFRVPGQRHQLTVHCGAPPAVVRGDRERLEQVLVNLIQNAIKYTPLGGPIVVRVERVGSEGRVSVSDPGIGVPKEEQPRLFQRFFRAANATTRNYGGLGIGLYVSNEIVKQHGGRFEVESESDAGSTFTFYVPLAETTSKATSDTPRARVLLVDDDPEILEATGQVLREWGYVVDEARDGRTALLLARSAPHDLLMVDLMMPVMDGWTLIQRLRDEQLAAGVPVLVFSADRDAREKARRMDADAALRKPFELEELQDVMERLLSRPPAAC